MMVTLASSAPSAEPEADPGYGFYGHHVYHGPPCKPAFVEETKEVCHIEPEKVEVHTVVTQRITFYNQSGRQGKYIS